VTDAQIRTLRHIHITPGALSDRRAWSLVVTYSSSLAAVWQQCGNSLAAVQWQSTRPAASISTNRGAWFTGHGSQYVSGYALRMWNKQLVIQGIANREHLRRWVMGGGGHVCHGPWMPKDPTVNRPVSTSLNNKKHKLSLQFVTTGSARNKQKKYNKWMIFRMISILTFAWHNENWCDPPGKLHPN
jgi:hypothetical protein